MNNFPAEIDVRCNQVQLLVLESCCDFLLPSFEGREGENQLLFAKNHLHLDFTTNPLFISSATLDPFVTPQTPNKPAPLPSHLVAHFCNVHKEFLAASESSVNQACNSHR